MSEVQQEQAPVALKNKQLIIYLFAGAIIAVAGFFGYTELYQKPLEAKAADARKVAENYFANDTSKLVLKGDETTKGVYTSLRNLVEQKRLILHTIMQV